MDPDQRGRRCRTAGDRGALGSRQGAGVGTDDDAGWVHLLSRDDGQPLNRFGTDNSGIAATPVAAANTLVVVTRNGAVYGFRPD